MTNCTHMPLSIMSEVRSWKFWRALVPAPYCTLVRALRGKELSCTSSLWMNWKLGRANWVGKVGRGGGGGGGKGKETIITAITSMKLYFQIHIYTSTLEVNVVL